MADRMLGFYFACRWSWLFSFLLFAFYKSSWLGAAVDPSVYIVSDATVLAVPFPTSRLCRRAAAVGPPVYIVSDATAVAVPFPTGCFLSAYCWINLVVFGSVHSCTDVYSFCSCLPAFFSVRRLSRDFVLARQHGSKTPGDDEIHGGEGPLCT